MLASKHPEYDSRVHLSIIRRQGNHICYSSNVVQQIITCAGIKKDATLARSVAYGN